ncbi:hypothetical protein B0T24DRAFT_609913 [Lasiosphaeria ovina]|uniref:Uncharacterized protein n=1 Tax=Lasiosphaeria ovina TaxID=92902 RepID=A0AAE0KM63_9PEZI|nr:hypothetical protein B0T24DRAFT_609913 [Lasiosphaeria ovina]
MSQPCKPTQKSRFCVYTSALPRRGLKAGGQQVTKACTSSVFTKLGRSWAGPRPWRWAGRGHMSGIRAKRARRLPENSRRKSRRGPGMAVGAACFEIALPFCTILKLHSCGARRRPSPTKLGCDSLSLSETHHPLLLSRPRPSLSRALPSPAPPAAPARAKPSTLPPWRGGGGGDGRTRLVCCDCRPGGPRSSVQIQVGEKCRIDSPAAPGRGKGGGLECLHPPVQ